MSLFVQRLLVVLCLGFMLFGSSACAARSGARDSWPASIERPAESASEGKDALDYIGEVAVVLLALGSLAAGIALPILLFL